jgi:hypothetical protein
MNELLLVKPFQATALIGQPRSKLRQTNTIQRVVAFTRNDLVEAFESSAAQYERMERVKALTDDGLAENRY